MQVETDLKILKVNNFFREVEYQDFRASLCPISYRKA